MVPALDPSPGPVRVALAGPMLTAHAACTCAKAPPRGAPPRAGAVNAQPEAIAAMAPRTAPIPAHLFAMTAEPARPAPERARPPTSSIRACGGPVCRRFITFWRQLTAWHAPARTDANGRHPPTGTVRSDAREHRPERAERRRDWAVVEPVDTQ